MSDALPLNIIVGYSLFAFFAAEQKFAVRDFRGNNQVFYTVLIIFMSATSIFGIGYLIYYALSVAWWAAVVLFFIGLLVFVPLGFIGAVIPSRILALASFIASPLLGIYLLRSVPSI